MSNANRHPQQQTQNEDPAYYEKIFNQLDEMDRSYLKSKTEQSVQNEVTNLQKGYEYVRQYLLELADPPAPVKGPAVNLLKDPEPQPMSPLKYPDTESSVPALNSAKITVPAFAAEVSKEEKKRREKEAKDKAAQEAEELKKRKQAERLAKKQKQLEEQQAKKLAERQAKEKAAEEKRLAKQAAKETATKTAAKEQTGNKYLVELSDFSDYMRYPISRKFKAGHYCYNCCLFVLLTLIAIFTGATVYLILRGMCCGAGASINVPAKRDLQKIGEEQIQRILEAIKNVKLAIPEVHAPKVTINDE